MSAALALAGVGLGAGLLGGGMNAVGTLQGAKALRREKARQLDELRAFQAQRAGALQSDIDRTTAVGPGEQLNAQIGDSLAAQERAVTGAADAGAAELGLTPDAARSVVASARPAMRLKAGAMAEDLRGDRRALQQAELAGIMAQINGDQERAQALWEQREAVAAQKGQALRTIGTIVGGMGMPLMSMGMAGAAPGGGAKAPATGAATYGGGAYPGPAQAGGSVPFNYQTAGIH